MIFLKKIYKNIFSSNVLKYGLSKKIALEYDYSCYVIWKDEIFFPENMTVFCGRKMKDHLSQKLHGNMILRMSQKDAISKKHCAGK